MALHSAAHLLVIALGIVLGILGMLLILVFGFVAKDASSHACLLDGTE